MEQKLHTLPSAGLAYYTSEYPGLQCLPCPPSLQFQRCQTGDTVPAKKPSTELLLANCGVLFHGCMSARAVIVSVIITTCSLAPFRFHHLGSIKQPAAGSGVDCPGAATVRLWVSEDNCRLCTNSPGLSPEPLSPHPASPSGRREEKTQRAARSDTNSHSPGRD